MGTHHFYGEEYASPEIRQLFDDFLQIWAADTCAPRMRASWSEENPTLGQCSITSFLVQDLLGGEVYGVPLEDGNYHCYNVIDGRIFDLTSEQFREEKLVYDCRNPQSRDIHFSKEEKHERYCLLKKRYGVRYH